MNNKEKIEHINKKQTKLIGIEGIYAIKLNEDINITIDNFVKKTSSIITELSENNPKKNFIWFMPLNGGVFVTYKLVSEIKKHLSLLNITIVPTAKVNNSEYNKIKYPTLYKNLIKHKLEKSKNFYIPSTFKNEGNIEYIITDDMIDTGEATELHKIIGDFKDNKFYLSTKADTPFFEKYSNNFDIVKFPNKWIISSLGLNGDLLKDEIVSSEVLEIIKILGIKIEKQSQIPKITQVLERTCSIPMYKEPSFKFKNTEDIKKYILTLAINRSLQISEDVFNFMLEIEQEPLAEKKFKIFDKFKYIFKFTN